MAANLSDLAVTFAALREGKIRYSDIVGNIRPEELADTTQSFFENIHDLLKEATDDDITFVPVDPKASEGDERGWTLGHLVAHITAGIEENATRGFLLARGLAPKERYHTEVPWENIQTVQQAQARLQESQRITQALLNAWPDQPDLQTTFEPVPWLGPINAIGITMLGIFHGQTHIEQIHETLKQAKAR